MFAAHGKAKYATCATFVSGAALKAGIGERLGLKKKLLAVSHCRDIGKKDMRHNDSTPEITVNPETYEVRADGELLRCEAAASLPLARLYNLF
jgi:urease subunit alpha